jgi:hypothetical protein
MISIEYPSGVIDLENEFYMPCHSLYIDLFFQIRDNHTNDLYIE